MIAWRLARRRHGPALDGMGGRFAEGRWNTRGSPVCYCTSSPALAVLEKRVHVPRFSDLPADLVMYKVEIPDDLPAIEAIDSLAAGWHSNVAYTQSIGDRACAAHNVAVLIVPSVIVEMDRNILLIGSHGGNGRIRVVAEHPIALDRRLFD